MTWSSDFVLPEQRHWKNKLKKLCACTCNQKESGVTDTGRTEAHPPRPVCLFHSPPTHARPTFWRHGASADCGEDGGAWRRGRRGLAKTRAHVRPAWPKDPDGWQPHGAAGIALESAEGRTHRLLPDRRSPLRHEGAAPPSLAVAMQIFSSPLLTTDSTPRFVPPSIEKLGGVSPLLLFGLLLLVFFLLLLRGLLLRNGTS